MDDQMAMKLGSRGDRADQLLKDELYQECFDAVEDNLRKRWEATSYKDNDERENIWRMLKALGMVKTQLQSVAQTGQVARQFLVRKASRAIGLNSQNDLPT
ncbi:hypothetical protein FHW69_001603 [Luteibacter sp. Sphag1AF]|uniref:hypothetical protein n=1 Tax=Luteibacter sp. Sphag1AF TaxID=2587031 RepID=UPI00160B2253|nr:hypothetical protein [Luteibacter sp. Sphag1AF]MBB3227002.1 hypothetical protein [Luteibacter sp. Sphag1AF]